jgi:thioredoxin 1
MLRPILIFAVVIGGYLYSRQSGGGFAGSGQGTLLSDAKLPADITQSKKPVLVDFWAPWCGPCVALGPTISALAMERKDIVVVKVNTDEKRDVLEKFNIRGIPCLILFKDGKEVDRIVGGVPKAAIEQMIAKHK